MNSPTYKNKLWREGMTLTDWTLPRNVLYFQTDQSLTTFVGNRLADMDEKVIAGFDPTTCAKMIYQSFDSFVFFRMLDGSGAQHEDNYKFLTQLLTVKLNEDYALDYITINEYGNLVTKRLT